MTGQKRTASGTNHICKRHRTRSDSLKITEETSVLQQTNKNKRFSQRISLFKSVMKHSRAGQVSPSWNQLIDECRRRPAAHLEDIDGGTVAAAAGPARTSAPASLMQASCKNTESFDFSEGGSKKESYFTSNISYQVH